MHSAHCCSGQEFCSFGHCFNILINVFGTFLADEELFIVKSFLALHLNSLLIWISDTDQKVTSHDSKSNRSLKTK